MVNNGANPNLAPDSVVNQYSALFNYLKDLYKSLCDTLTPNSETTTFQAPVPQFLRDYKCNKKNITPQKVANAIWHSVSSKGGDKATLIDDFLFWAKNTQGNKSVDDNFSNSQCHPDRPCTMSNL